MGTPVFLITPIFFVIEPEGPKTLTCGGVACGVRIPVSCAQPGAAPPPDAEEPSSNTKTKTNDTAKNKWWTQEALCIATYMVQMRIAERLDVI